MRQFKSEAVSMLLGIEPARQRKLREMMRVAQVEPLGEGNGHWTYDWVDLCFLQLLTVIAARVKLDSAIVGLLSRPPDFQSETRHPASWDIRDRLTRVFAYELVAPISDDRVDVKLYYPLAGPEGYATPLWFLSAKETDGIISGDPQVDENFVFKARPAHDHLVTINISRLVRRLLDFSESIRPAVALIEAAHDITRGSGP